MLAVMQLGCSAFDYTSVAVTDAVFWQDSWELYKHQYAISRWAFVRNIVDIEFFNEPDLTTCYPALPQKWLEIYTLRTGAILDAFQGLSHKIKKGKERKGRKKKIRMRGSEREVSAVANIAAAGHVKCQQCCVAG